jgi:myo-inositol-1(or 4)-monophosphatase
MMRAGIESRRELAEAAVIAAGQVLTGFFRTPLESRTKRGGSMVTAADHAAEEVLTARIAAAFPEDSILAEEGGFTAGDPGWCWTLDGLDGTQNFLAGVPFFAVAVAVLAERRPVVGVIHDPMRGETYAAEQGRGAWRNGVPIRVRGEPLGPSSLIAVRHRFLRREADRLYDVLPTRKFRSLGSMSMELALVSAGAIDGVVANRPHLWDIAPGVVLVEEAGGVVSGFDGGPIFPLAATPGDDPDRRYRIAAGNAAAVRELVAHLRVLPA